MCKFKFPMNGLSTKLSLKKQSGKYLYIEWVTPGVLVVASTDPALKLNINVHGCEDVNYSRIRY